MYIGGCKKLTRRAVMVNMVQEFCIVCSSMYVCNALILLLSTTEFLRAIASLHAKGEQKRL